jgi:excisionase family DNA binding protein
MAAHAQPTEAVRLLTVIETAALLSCSKDHVYDLISRGEISEVVDIGNGRAKTRIPEPALAAYIAGRTRKVTAQRTT